MSESSKMGLFGSKDENNKEPRKDSAKGDSPDRYAPYCIDSDSEAYDTEALSMMDINDIIGVQSDPVGESTLESEIAALSQIITDAKTDVGQNAAGTKTEAPESSVTAANESADTDGNGLDNKAEAKDRLDAATEESVDSTDNRDTQNEEMDIEKLKPDVDVNPLECTSVVEDANSENCRVQYNVETSEPMETDPSDTSVPEQPESIVEKTIQNVPLESVEREKSVEKEESAKDVQESEESEEVSESQEEDKIDTNENEVSTETVPMESVEGSIASPAGQPDEAAEEETRKEEEVTQPDETVVSESNATTDTPSAANDETKTEPEKVQLKEFPDEAEQYEEKECDQGVGKVEEQTVKEVEQEPKEVGVEDNVVKEKSPKPEEPETVDSVSEASVKLEDRTVEGEDKNVNVGIVKEETESEMPSVEEPACVSQKEEEESVADPVCASEEDATMDQKDSSTSEQDPGVDQEDSAMDQESSTVDRESDTMDQEEPVVEQENPSMDQEDGAVDQEESAMEQEHPVMDQEDSTANEKDSAMDYEISTADEIEPPCQEDPVASQEDVESSASGKESPTSVQESHAVDPEKPTIDQKDHAVDQEEPTAMDQEASDADKGEEEDAITEQEKSTTNQEDHTLDQEKSTTDQEDHTLDQEKSTTDQEDHTLDQEKSTTDQEDHTLDQEKSTTDQEDHTLDQEKSTTDQEDHTMDQEDRPSDQEDPVIDQESPTMDKEDSIVVQEKPATDQEDNTVDHEKSTTDQEDFTMDQEKPPTAQEDLKDQEGPAADQVDPVTSLEGSTIAQEDLSTDQKSPSIVEENPLDQEGQNMDEETSITDEKTTEKPIICEEDEEALTGHQENLPNEQKNPSVKEDDSMDGEKPVTTQEDSIMDQEQPTSDHENPTEDKDDPPMEQESTTVNQEDQEGPTTDQDDSTMNEKEPTIEPQTPTIDPEDCMDREKPVTDQEDSIIDQKELVIDQEDSAMNQEEAAPVQEESAVDEEIPATKQEDLSVDQDEPTKDQEDGSMDQEKPTADQEDSTMDQEEPAVNQEDHTMNEEKLIIDQEGSTMDEKKPIIDQEEPTMDPEKPVTDQEELTMDPEEPVTDKEDSQMEQENPVIDQDTVPDQETAPTDQEKLIIDHEDSSMDQDDTAVDRGASAMDQEAAPSDQEKLIIDQEVSSMDQDDTALDQRDSAMDQEAAPSDQGKPIIDQEDSSMDQDDTAVDQGDSAVDRGDSAVDQDTTMREEDTAVEKISLEQETSSPVTVAPVSEESECLAETKNIETQEDTKGESEVKSMEVNDSKEEAKVDVREEDQPAEREPIEKAPCSPPAEEQDAAVSEEDLLDESTEEEMNLTLDPEESQLESEIDTANCEQLDKLEEVALAEEEKAEAIDESGAEDLEERMIEKEEALEAEKSLNMETHHVSSDVSSDNVDMSVLTKADEQEEKHSFEESSKSDSESNNLKSILDETANNVAGMFSEEQCQNTQDIVTSILDDVRNVTDFKNILDAESGVENEIEKVLQETGDLPLVEAEIEELAEKLPEESSEDILTKAIVDDPITGQNIDSLEGLLGLDLIPESEDSELKVTKPEEEEAQETGTLEKDVDMALFLGQSNRTPDMAQESDYITDVISSCLTSANDVPLRDTDDKSEIVETGSGKVDEAAVDNELLKVNEEMIAETMDKEAASVDEIQKQLEEDTELAENDLDMDFEGNPLDTVGDLDESESKLGLATDMLLEGVDQGSEILNDPPSGLETSQPSSEISELESAVKFLQESEEQAIDSPLVLSPKMVESVVEDISKQTDPSSLFVHDEDMCDDASVLVAELQDITRDSIAISEAEIISEAAKLENERKLAEQSKIQAVAPAPEFEDEKLDLDEMKSTVVATIDTKPEEDKRERLEMQGSAIIEGERIAEAMPLNILKPSESIPKVSILEERLKEPPKIEIPTADVTKVPISPSAPKDSLLIQKDAKLIAYQKMLESPKLTERPEPKSDTPRKDSEKHDFENVGSPRIILKIAKSAIADCSEPRSPKSPKIRSATNSPNPEDSPGQKLGKIKLKLSKGGHPSIISNENVEEAGQWHSEGASCSLSPLGMKIKLSKSGDASIVSSEKYEGADESKEGKYKFEEAKRTESPIGMKIKLSKSGDASIVQDSKDIAAKHKDKLDMMQGSPKRTESPIGMKIKLSKSGDASIVQPEKQDMLDDYKDSSKTRDMSYDSPKRTDSPIGMKIKFSRTGDASIVSPDIPDDIKEARMKERTDSSPDIPKRTESPIGMKFKLSKTKGGASITPVESTDDPKDKLEVPDVPKRTESPLGMKIKLSKTGDASIIHSEVCDEPKEAKTREKLDHEGSEDLPGLKIKVSKTMDPGGGVQESTDAAESSQETPAKVESPLGMKIKLSKFGDLSIVPTDKQESMDDGKPTDAPKRTESPLGMKIKLSRTGDASIVQSETAEDLSRSRSSDGDHSKPGDSSLGMKIKLLKTGDGSIIETEKKERQSRRREAESPLEMKIKLSKTGHPTIVACESHAESSYKSKETMESPQSFAHRYKEPMMHKEPALKILKSGNSTILQSNRSELTIEPVQMQGKKGDGMMDISPKRKEITISPIESKKSKLETQLSQILPEVTIQPVMSRDQKQLLFDPKNSLISRQQMSVISQEISITQVRPMKNPEPAMNEKLKDILSKTVSSNSPLGSDCEIIEHRPELIIVNENSNSSQDVVIIEEVPPNRVPEVKVPKKRGRPRRNPAVQPPISQAPSQVLMPRDPLALEEAAAAAAVASQSAVPAPVEHRENERPKRTCRSQKSYAPPKRGRGGRGRGKRKLEPVEAQLAKKPRIDQDLSAIEASTMAVITMNEQQVTQQQDTLCKSPELYKALKQPPMDTKTCALSPGKGERQQGPQPIGQRDLIKGSDSLGSPFIGTGIATQTDLGRTPELQAEASKMVLKPPGLVSLDPKDQGSVQKRPLEPERLQKKAEDKSPEKSGENSRPDNKEMLVPPGHPNWLTPTSKRPATAEAASRQENLSTVQVIDEETRMSAESGSRSQTPARNLTAQASETILNEESQGSVLSTATTESEKVKVKNRRMEINFDPDEGPFTVDKIAEYDWPLDRKGDTFMIQEQISQYLGVKSFKRKYPDLKRRMVDMEERNYLRENGLVSEAMCDMGLTAVYSSEVLDVMCSDFPDQYEEYRKHMREKQVKEHSKKQKELTAAANAEKNRIDLAEMAVQSALTWNINLNKARRENRKCSLDLQTFTIHVPKKQQKVEADRKVSHYPVALIPGQYTDYYREYTAAELRYYPLNTVLYGPMRPNERKFDSQSEGSQSDSDSDSSSDDSSSSSSEGTQDTEGSQSTMDEVDMEIASQKDEVKLKCKMCLKTLNKHSKNEVLIQCGACNGNVHPSCIDLTLDMVPHIQSYAWQCTDCKTCAQCHDPADEDKMLFCDMCDRGYHIYCVGLRRVPQGRWHCQECAVCANCGSREPGGVNSDRNSVAQWQHEFKKGDKNTRVYVSTLCVPCSKLWRKGRYCPHCSRCHTAPRLDLEPNLVHCSACDKYLHLGCVETKGVVFDRKNYQCDFCAPNRQPQQHQQPQVMVKPLVSKPLKA